MSLLAVFHVHPTPHSYTRTDYNLMRGVTMNYSLFQNINGLAGHSHAWDSFMIFIADKSPFIIIGVLFIIWLTESLTSQNTYRQTTVLLAMITFLFGLGMNAVIHLLYWHPRPFVNHHVHQLIPHSATESSFVSDHALLVFSISFILLQRMPKWGYITFLFAILTGFSRIYVGVHYPADVIGAALLAAIIGWTVLKQETRLKPFLSVILNMYGKLLSLTPLGKRITKNTEQM